MSKKLLCTLLVAVMIVATALTGCGGTNDDSKSNTGEVVWNIKTNPKSWDPGKNANAEGGHISNNIFEGLMKDTEDGTLEPGVAESYDLIIFFILQSTEVHVVAVIRLITFKECHRVIVVRSPVGDAQVVVSLVFLFNTG